MENPTKIFGYSVNRYFGGLHKQVRNHPMMVYKGRPNWPPLWSWISGPDRTAVPEGEASTLENAQISRVLRNTIFLTIAAPNGNRYMGTLKFETETAADMFFQVFRSHFGQTVKSIAELHIP